MILGTILTRDIIIWFVMLIICAVFFLAMGIMLLITKKTTLISKKARFKEGDKLCNIYGAIEVIVATLLIIISIIGLIFTKIYLPLFIAALLLLLGLLLALALVQKNYTV